MSILVQLTQFVTFREDALGHKLISGITSDTVELISNLDDSQLKLGGVGTDLATILSELKVVGTKEEIKNESADPADSKSVDLMNSRLKGIDFNYTQLINVSPAIKTLELLSCLTYL